MFGLNRSCAQDLALQPFALGMRRPRFLAVKCLSRLKSPCIAPAIGCAIVIAKRSRDRPIGPRAELRELESMEEFEGGFLRSVVIGLVLALGFSILFVWFR